MPEAEKDEVGDLKDRAVEAEGEAKKFKYAFDRLKAAAKNVVEGVHWVLRLGVLGGSFWFLGWRMAAGVLAFILADELIRLGKKEIEEIVP